MNKDKHCNCFKRPLVKQRGNSKVNGHFGKLQRNVEPMWDLMAFKTWTAKLWYVTTREFLQRSM